MLTGCQVTGVIKHCFNLSKCLLPCKGLNEHKQIFYFTPNKAINMNSQCLIYTVASLNVFFA